MRTLTLRLDNMHCGSCVRRVSQVLNSLPATHAEEVRVGTARVRTEQSDTDLHSALAAAGFPAQNETGTP
jgi:copper chaperone